MELTRRRFLQALGAVGGAGVVLGAMEALELAPGAADHREPFVPPSRSDFTLQGRVNDTSVLILGAGVAGLAAAYELEKAGYRCEVIEARDRPGGRNWTVRGGTTATEVGGVTQTATFPDGHYMNAGPARVPQHHVTLDYYRELGIPIEVFANQNAHAYVFNGGRFGASGPLVGQKVRYRTAKADYAGYVGELLAKAVNQRALDDTLDGDDRERLLEFLRATGALGPSDRYVGSPNRGYDVPPGAGAQPGTVGQPFDLSDLLASALGLYFPFEASWDQAMPMFQPVGGMDRLPYALADALVGRIRYRSEVKRITVGDERVTVDFADEHGDGRRIEADYAVCTIPPPVLRDIETNLPAQITADLASLQMVSTGKLGLYYRRRFWEEDDRIFGGITSTDMDISTIWYPSYGYLGGDGGVVIGYYNFVQDADAYAAMAPADRVRQGVAQGVKVHGDAYRDELESSFSVAWIKTPFNLGGWVAWPEERGEAFTRLLERQGNLWFAGDHLGYVTAWQHGALESARRVVTELHTAALAQ